MGAGISHSIAPVMLAIIIGVFYSNRRFDDLRRVMNEKFANINEDMKEIKGLLLAQNPDA